MKRYLFDPRIFDGPALFDLSDRWRPNYDFVVTLCRRHWSAVTKLSGWAAETRPSGWKAAVRRDEG